VVIVVVNDKSWAKKDNLTALINKINEFSPKDILLFKEYPEQFPNIKELHPNINIVPISHKKITNRQLIELELAEGFNKTPHIGAAIPPQLGDGIIRMSSLQFTTHKGIKVKSFLHHFTPTPLNKDYFPINFDKVTPFLVKVTSDQILQDKSVKQLFNKKIVTLGHSTFAKQAILRTPFRHTNLGFSLLEFHAISLEAVLNDAELNSLSIVNQIILISCNILLILFIMNKFSIHSNLFLLYLIISVGAILLNLISHAIESLWV
jgi:hypothetical protein